MSGTILMGADGKAATDRPERGRARVRIAASRDPFRTTRAMLGRLGRLLVVACWLAHPATAFAPAAESSATILVYHRFSATADDSMTVRVVTFEAQLRYLHEHGYHFVPLRDIVNWIRDPAAVLPSRPVALTLDDGHRSVFEALLPIVLRDRLPVTLFIYPSAISNASYALTWDQLRTLGKTGLFDIQSHTYWHPNFKVERRRRSAADFRQFVRTQLDRSRKRLEAETGARVDMLAWPFGIYDDELMSIAAEQGYAAGFTLVGRRADRHAALLALPRFLMTDAHGPAALARLLGDAPAQPARTGEQQP
ncbi:polysaccharide deacetylase family protein [Burkholderia sp. MS455]|uniref:polysaccharide deacetylase family protein n=1 Tax=Burkholderia sp. MS455 TaxID=2811788 RepID=UPI00195F16BF